MQSTDIRILKARIERRNKRRLADAGGAVNVDDDRSTGRRHLAQEA
jgi:ribosomal protein L32